MLEDEFESEFFLQTQSRQAQVVPDTCAHAQSVERQIPHERRTAWLKEHGEEYRGVYVALDDACEVVGQGPTIRDADQQARAKGVKNHFWRASRAKANSVNNQLPVACNG